jgi:hypothetical protein
MRHLHDGSFRLPFGRESTLDASLLEDATHAGPFGPAPAEQLPAELAPLEDDCGRPGKAVVPAHEALGGRPFRAVVPDEVLVLDARAGLTPAQFVERRLIALLRSTPLSSSRRTLRGRVA